MPSRPFARALRLPLVAALGLLVIDGHPATSRAAAAQSPFDIVLAGGRVMDPETGLDAVRNVGIRGDLIAAVSEGALDGEVVIDVSGLIVAPGFIDLHAHGQSAAANVFQAHDGVTTALELEGGVGDVAGFLAARAGNAVINYGASVAQSQARVFAMPQYADTIAQLQAANEGGDQQDLAALFAALQRSAYEAVEPGQFAAMKAALARGLQAGALGIGVPHQYYPGASREEIFEVFRMAAGWRVPIYTHVRGMNIDAFQEVIANAAATGASLHIVHVNSSSLWRLPTVLELIGGARERGIDVTTEAYPYTAASTGLESSIFDEGWQEALQIGYEDIQLQDTGERLTAETFETHRAAGAVVIIHMMKPEWIELAIKTPFVMVASDGMPYAPGAHPRSAGTFTRVLGRYVREQELIPVMEAITRMTLLPAQRLETVAPAARRKGRIQKGTDADITVFDPGRVIDTATFEADLTEAEGVRHVLVNGVFVVRDGETVEGVFPGRPLLGRMAEDT